ncbi:MAG: hypothetical protein GY799_24925 [Desulfobulbaceae bacterium]|nr:hypothetical protein [Desulfobulbaceae bacterium]
MKRKQIQIVIVIPLLIFMIAGCGVQFSSRSLQSTEIPPVHLSQSSPDGIWQGKEVSLSYTIDSYKPLFSLSGTLQLNPSILMSYPIIKSFFFRIHFLDADGKLLSSSPIHINYGHHTFAEQESSFNFSREIPSQVEAFTFSYSGTFSDYGERFPDTTYIEYSPVH